MTVVYLLYYEDGQNEDFEIFGVFGTVDKANQARLEKIYKIPPYREKDYYKVRGMEVQ